MDTSITSRTFSLTEMVRERRDNELDRWTTAAARLWSGEMVRVATQPKWKISRGGLVFTIGSCFARHAEWFLDRLGMNVPALHFRVPAEYHTAGARNNSVLNKYNTASIESEVLLAFGMADYPDDGLIDAGEGLWWDPLTTHMKLLPRDAVVETRRQITELTRTIRDADAVLVTLGLNQIWQDTETGVFLNEMPPPELARRLRDRLALSVAGYEDNFQAFDTTVQAIHEVNPGCKIVVTVSPVPMAATLTRFDVIQENMLSKSILRSVAQAAADRYDHVDYFPSYEMVMYSPPELTWEEDRLHVRGDAVQFVISSFIDDYVE